MANGKATASFFENGTTAQFEYCFKMYPQVLKLKAEKRCKKPQELIRLDQWYQNELPKLIKARGKDAHMVYDELVQTMKWKQSRGKFYPQLSYLVKVNTPRAVMQETKKAFRKLPNLEQAITALSNLKGVGTTMASALLAAAAPEKAPFMADECLMAIPEIEGIDYTTKEYLNFVQHIQSTVERLNIEVGGETPKWSPHRVELALWSHYVANDLNPELLEEMPAPGVGAVNTNGSINNTNADDDVDGDGVSDGVGVKVLDGEDDTNDGDDESFGAVGRRNNANESENENTNSASLDKATVAANIVSGVGSGGGGGGIGGNSGVSAVINAASGDSNFISNDSTSQEQIIDENTTQTTTTTSTDDGEAIGTPLASDSESNIEAPLKANHHHIANANANINAVVANTSSIDITEIGVQPQPPPSATATLVSNNKINNNGSVAGVVVEGTTAHLTDVATVGAATAAPVTNNAANTLSPLVVANAIGNGNGNGSLSIGNSDRENSNCVLSKRVAQHNEVDDDDDDDDDDDVDDEEDEDDDEEDDDEVVDDESNSNSHGRIDNDVLAVGKTKATAVGIGSENVKNDTSTLSSSGGGSVVGGGGVVGNLTSPTIGQKRTALHCGVDAGGGGVGGVVGGIGGETNSQPELKKLRSE